MTKLKNWLRENRISFISYGIAFAVLLAALIVMHVSPFGSKESIKIDLYHAYAPELMQFRDVLTGDASWFHTWTGGLGTNAFSLLIFHVLSPFSLIVLLFPREAITEAVTVMILLKIPVTAFTMSFFLRHKFGKNGLTVVIFSLMFALCAFVTAYYWSYPWIDVIFTLPLVALGIERLVKQGKGVLYCLSLAYAIYAYFYMAAFVCMFAVMYLIATIYLERGFGDRPALVRMGGKFLGLSVIAAALTAFVNIPVIITLTDTSYLKSGGLGPVRIFDLLKYLAGHFWALNPAMREGTDNAGPNIYAGLLALVLIPFFYLNKKIPRKEKITFTVMMGLMVMVMEVSTLNYAAHLMHQPAGLPYRMSFIYSFVLLIMAFRSFNSFEFNLRKKIPLVFGCFTAAILLLFVLGGNDGEFPVPSSFTVGAMILNIVLIGIYLGLIYAKKPRESLLGRYFSVVLLCAVCLEIGFSTYRNFSYEMSSAENANEFYRDYEGDMAQITAKLDTETAFYRATFHRTHVICDGKLYNLRDISQFIAPTSAATIEIMSALGVTASMNSIIFVDPTPFVSSIFAVKNILTRNYFVGDYFYKVKEQIGKVVMYDNPYVLPVGFMVDLSALNWDIKSSKSTYDLQNDLARRMTGVDGDMFHQFLAEGFSAENAKITRTGDTSFSYVLDDPQDLDNPAVIKVEYTVPETARLYLRYNATACKNVKVYASDVNRREYTASQAVGTGMDVGYMVKGTKIEVVFTHDQINQKNKRQYEKTGSIELYASQMDMPVYEKVIASLKTQPLEVDSFTDETLSGTVTAQEDGLLYTSIPYDQAWRITVDGETVEPVVLGGALTAIPLAEGGHRVEFVYKQQGLTAGIIVSLAGILTLAGWQLWETKRRKR